VNKQSSGKLLLAVAASCALLLAAACQFGGKEFAAISDAELTTLADTLPTTQRITLRDNPQARKGMIDEFKKRYALAQAALAEGLDKNEDFSRNFALTTARVLAQEFSKRNESAQFSKQDLDGYVAAHQKEFEADLSFVNKNSKQPLLADQVEGLKANWAELQLRAEKGRQAGLEKDPGVQAQLKTLRAEMLANAYANKLEEKYKPTDADLKNYYAQHPEFDPEKIRLRMNDLLARLKKGEAFEKIADEINEDGTKGKGGDLDWFGAGTMDPDFEKAAFALQPGQVSQELVKSSFGYHLIKVEGRRKAEAKPQVPPGTPGSNLNQVAGGPKPAPNGEEVHAKHIYLSTKTGEEMIGQQAQEKMKRAVEDATLKYPVATPQDFKINLAALRQPSGTPAPGGGIGGSMKMIDPNEKK
jgi:parvulin-like peptidyl-prolyl isomerase